MMILCWKDMRVGFITMIKRPSRNHANRKAHYLQDLRCYARCAIVFLSMKKVMHQRFVSSGQIKDYNFSITETDSIDRLLHYINVFSTLTQNFMKHLKLGE